MLLALRVLAENLALSAPLKRRKVLTTHHFDGFFFSFSVLLANTIFPPTVTLCLPVLRGAFMAVLYDAALYCQKHAFPILNENKWKVRRLKCATLIRISKVKNIKIIRYKNKIAFFICCISPIPKIYSRYPSFVLFIKIIHQWVFNLAKNPLYLNHVFSQI